MRVTEGLKSSLSRFAERLPGSREARKLPTEDRLGPHSLLISFHGSQSAGGLHAVHTVQLQGTPQIEKAREQAFKLFPSPGDLPNPGIAPRSPAVQVDSLSAEPEGKPKNTGVGSLSLLQRIFLTQESNRCLLHCRWILYQLSYQGSHKAG